MPSIRKNDYGYYFLDAYVNGKRKRITLDTKSYRLATAKANELLRKLDEEPQTTRMTIQDLKESYLAWCAPPRHSHATYKNAEGILKRLSGGLQQHIEYADQITPTIADEFITRISKQENKRSKKIMSSRGINYYIRGLRAIFNFALTRGVVKSNPFLSVKKFREEDIRPRSLTMPEAKAFFAKLRQEYPEYLTLFMFYLFTGLRRSEALNLEWDHVSWDTDTIIVMGKGKKIRYVPMMKTVKAILMQRRADPKPFPWKADDVTHKFVAVKKLAGLEGVKLHDIRKSFATLLADYSVSDFFIQNWLGHEDRKITTTHYIGKHDRETQAKLKALEAEVILSVIPEGTLPTS